MFNFLNNGDLRTCPFEPLATQQTRFVAINQCEVGNSNASVDFYEAEKNVIKLKKFVCYVCEASSNIAWGFFLPRPSKFS